MTLRVQIVAASIVALGASTAMADTFNVVSGQSIQAAITAAADGDEIFVGPGTYVENLDMQGKGLTLRSTNGPMTTIIDGGGIASVISCDVNVPSDCEPIIDGFTITNGLGSFGQGGGIRLRNADGIILNCIVTNNTAGAGGGVFCNGSNARFFGCVFRDNTATSLGGAAFVALSSPVFVNCTFGGDSASAGAGIWTSDVNSRPGILNCIVWGYEDDSFAGSGEAIVSYSTVEGGFPGAGNIDFNPLFVNFAGGDLRLQNGSPAIDAADSTIVAETLAVDIDGNPRGADVTTVADTGIPIFGLTVDMGAFEFPVGDGGPTECDCPADVAPPGGNGTVNVDDLIAVIVAFGACPPADPTEPEPDRLDGGKPSGSGQTLR